MASQAEQRDVTSNVREIEAHGKPEVKRQMHPPAKLGDLNVYKRVKGTGFEPV